jgi:hypothetical protein
MWSYQDLPEDQCIFVRGFRVKLFLGKIRAEAEPTLCTGRDEPESDNQLISIAQETDVRPSVYLL